MPIRRWIFQTESWIPHVVEGPAPGDHLLVDAVDERPVQVEDYPARALAA